MLEIKVENMTSDSSGKEVANQFIIRTSDAIYFQSYQSIIVKKTQDETILDKHYWDYSKTTGKYRNQFLGETKRETEKKIKTGIYRLADLNYK